MKTFKRFIGVLIIINILPTYIGFYTINNEGFWGGFLTTYIVYGVLILIILIVMFILWCFGFKY